MNDSYMDKVAEYTKLVDDRKACHRCHGLTNPADINGGCYDSEQIGPWTLWQGNLDAPLMVVGQDWDSKQNFMKFKGKEPAYYRTNIALIDLIGIAGVTIDKPNLEEGNNIVFFTNAILCLKDGNSQSEVHEEWFDNCSSFLRKQIEIVNPSVVVGLGKEAYRAILKGFGMKINGDLLKPEVELKEGRVLPNGSRVFAVYHCGALGQNINRKMEEQKRDWMRIKPFVKNGEKIETENKK